MNATVNKTDLLLESDPFARDEKAKNLFLESFKENAFFHYEHHPYIKKLWDEKKFHPLKLEESDLPHVPWMMINLFKEYQWKSVPDSEIVLTLTSSGTGGNKSYQFLNENSLRRVKLLAYNIYKALGITSDKVCNYLCFTYDPKVASDLGTAFTDELLTSFTKKKRVEYTFLWSEEKGDFTYDEERVLAILDEFEEEFKRDGTPVRILGFPAHLYRLLTRSQKRYNFGSDSFVQTGGGWKSHSGEEIPKASFRQLLSKSLGIPEKNSRDLLGLVEHGIPYVDCELGNLHIPNFSRVYIRSPYDLSLVREEGEVGLIQYLCTYNESYPAFSLLTTDYGSIHECTCSLAGPTLRMHGRAGIKKHMGCAITALKL